MDELMPVRIKEVALDLTTIPDPGRRIDENKPLGQQARRVAKNQLILDLALESEFNETMEIFDIFVNNMSTNDKRLNHELDVDANRPLAIKATEDDTNPKEKVSIY